MKNNKKRKYYRKCPYCGKRLEQSEMIRTNTSPSGWVCKDCYEDNIFSWDDEYSSNGN